MSNLSYDPTEFGSATHFARTCVAMDRELGMPDKPYTGELGRLVNEEHFRQEAAMRDDLGWCGTTPEQLRKEWDL